MCLNSDKGRQNLLLRRIKFEGLLKFLDTKANDPEKKIRLREIL